MLGYLSLSLLLFLILPADLAAKTIARSATGLGTTRGEAIEHALRLAGSQISGESCVLLAYEVQAEEPPREQHWVSLEVDFEEESLLRVDGWGDDRQDAIQDALTSAVAMTFGVDISVVELSQITETGGVLFDSYDRRTEAQIFGKITGYGIIEEKPLLKVYLVNLEAQYRILDTWRTVGYSIVPGGGLIYKNRRLEGFIYLGAEAALLAGAFWNRSEATDYRAKKNDPNNTFREREFYYDRETKYHNRSRTFLGFAVGIYTLNVVHALLVKPNVDGDTIIAIRSRSGKQISWFPFLVRGEGVTGVGVGARF